MNYCKSQGGNIATVYNNQENDVLIQITKATAYIGAESDGKGNWKWIDGSKWWQPAGTQHDGIAGRGETKIAMNTDKKWHDWATGDAALGVLCAKDLSGTVFVRCGVLHGCSDAILAYVIVMYVYVLVCR